MQKIRETLRVLSDDRAAPVLERLHGAANRQHLTLLTRLASQAGRWLTGQPLRWEALAPKLSDLSLALDPTSGVVAYLLARAVRARTIVEYGTSHGVSAIYLGLAVRHNGGGRVVGTELVREKRELALQNVAQAGLGDIVEIRAGDACSSLSDLEGPIDLLHNDGFPPAMLPVTRMLAPRMRPGAIVLAGNVAMFPGDHVEYVNWMRDPRNGFVSTRLPMAMGGELSVRS